MSNSSIISSISMEDPEVYAREITVVHVQAHVPKISRFDTPLYPRDQSIPEPDVPNSFTNWFICRGGNMFLF
jgi:hypothetical protein